MKKEIHEHPVDGSSVRKNPRGKSIPPRGDFGKTVRPEIGKILGTEEGDQKIGLKSIVVIIIFVIFFCTFVLGKI